jgi:hypothetical protein
MTPTQELVARVEPDLLRAIDGAGLNWVKRNIARGLAGWLVRLAVEIALSRVGVALLQLFVSLLPFLRQTLKPEYHGDLELIGRVLAQPKSLNDPAVTALKLTSTPPAVLLRDAR